MIVWALDPFLGDDISHEAINIRAANLVALLARTGLKDERIQTITVLSPEQLNWPQAFHGEWETRFREVVFARIKDFLVSPHHRLGELADRIEEPLLISQGLPSVRQSAADLLKVAENEEARLIVATTIARPRTSRWVLGSFCEALIAGSKIPLMILNPEAQIPDDIGRVRLATDLRDDDEDSKRELETAAGWAKSFSSVLSLEHRLLVPIAPMLEPGLTPAPLPLTDIQAYYEADRVQKHRVADEWCRAMTRDEGVQCEAKFISGVGSLTESLVASMAPDGASIAAISKGHPAREMIRHARVPVLVLPRT